jgi:acetyl esterase/lipase
LALGLLAGMVTAGAQAPQRPAPDFADVSYGPHERNVLDVWLPQPPTARPSPLVIFYHGGGFRGGDKRSLSVALLKGLRESGIAVAAANYRLTGTTPFPAQMHDSARALQFLRLHAKEYSIDPARVGATGGSAGAGISLWLAFHPDLKDAANPDPVLRQSTRLSAAVVYAAQSSYDPRFIKKLMNSDQVEGALLLLFGMKTSADVDNPKFHPLFEEASPINFVSAGDPPAMLFYPQANDPLPPNSPGKLHIHHPKFGFALKEKMAAAGIECVLLLREDFPAGAPVDRYVAFFREKLGAGAR